METPRTFAKEELKRMQATYALPNLRMKLDDRFETEKFLIQSGAQQWTLTAGSERALLYGVYDFLRLVLGVEWPYPDRDLQFVGNDEQQSNVHIHSRPQFKRRGLVFEVNFDADYIVASIDWAAKQKLNELFFTFLVWDEVKDRAAPELQRRGLEVTLGGHSIDYLNQKFSLYGEVGDLEYERAFIQQLQMYVKDNPRISKLSLWPRDIAGAVDLAHYIRFCERMDEALDIPVEHIAYNAGLDWRLLEKRTSTSSELPTLFAYWGRDYHMNAAPDERGERALSNWLATNDVTVFEYYSDHFMQTDLFPPLQKRIEKDAVEYHAAGVQGMLNLVVPYSGDDPFYKKKWYDLQAQNSYAFSRAVWGEADARTFNIMNNELEHILSAFTAFNVPLFPHRVVDPSVTIENEALAERVIEQLHIAKLQIADIDDTHEEAYMEYLHQRLHTLQASWTRLLKMSKTDR
ncbi:hypothetical protein [Geomicrobium sp. JCM 19039]|uniref:hypothetical protein n=1 Tax=Geomicrobium sp. JCM 19039 TaxID=1460636 RepID=UPI00045F3D85|nr:hypothetical protein [Geomicrobium sp. JCM 19039]GAK10519.1 hypothetical protein JCM19039_140 [Geomicrobium sp. JCM 19039]